MVSQCQEGEEPVLVTNRLQTNPSAQSPWPLLRGGLIVSCQAPAGTPIDDPAFIRAQALTVELAGACAIRAEGIDNVREVCAAVKVPVIGLIKAYSDASDVYITPRVEDVIDLAKAGASIVAVDATQRTRWNGQTLQEFYSEVRKATSVQLLADIDSVENAQIAVKLGFDAVATTLHGYTDKPSSGLPNLDLISEVARCVDVPLIAEGGFASPESFKHALRNGAWAVCVGTAITNPYLLTKQFLE
jgi:N-acylglucosamine-6-phosphate 2-epimerase